MAKFAAEQEKEVQKRIEVLQVAMEQQCRKHADEMNKYKQHVSELTSQYWGVCDRLLAEKQEKESALKQMKEMRFKFNNEMQEMNQSHHTQKSTATQHKTAR